jgi:hypothetical protein
MPAINTGAVAASASRPSRAPRTGDSRTSSTSATTSASETGRAHGCWRSGPPSMTLRGDTGASADRG